MEGEHPHQGTPSTQPGHSPASHTQVWAGAHGDPTTLSGHKGCEPHSLRGHWAKPWQTAAWLLGAPSQPSRPECPSSSLEEGPHLSSPSGHMTTFDFY